VKEYPIRRTQTQYWCNDAVDKRHKTQRSRCAIAEQQWQRYFTSQKSASATYTDLLG